jgi:predicted HicB family RNase H-like nuclease
VSHYKGERQRLTLRMPETLARKLDKIALSRGISLNDLMNECLERCLECSKSDP